MMAVRNLLLCLVLCRAGPAQVANPVTNGGFEELAANEFPVDWERVGDEAVVADAAHSGARSLLLRRTAEAVAGRRETGLNRVWKIDSGEQGRMLAVRHGGIRFWYKALSAAPDAVLRLNVIAMDERPAEGCGVPRAFYQVPRSHVGDGQWHEGVLAFDFGEVTRCRWLQVSPRVTGGEGTQWLLDDVRWVESVGALPAILSLQTYELPGGDCQVRCLMQNCGDAPLGEGRVTLTVPEALELAGASAEQIVRRLAPDTYEVAAWRLRGARRAGGIATAQFSAAGRTVEATCEFQPALDWIQFLAESCIMWPGQESTIAVVAYNRGNAELHDVALSLSLPEALPAHPEQGLRGRDAGTPRAPTARDRMAKEQEDEACSWALSVPFCLT